MSCDFDESAHAQFCKDFVLSYPNAFLLLATIYYKFKDYHPSKNQIHFSLKDMRCCGSRRVLTPSTYRTALSQLERMGIIKIEKSHFKGCRFITVLINPFFTTEREIFPCQG
jgi:hypothetical protein